MSLESNLHTIITTAPSFTALAGTRLYPVLLPEEPTLPAATYQRISTTREYTTTGPVALNRVRIQLDCWADTYAQVKQLQAAILAILEDRSPYTSAGIDSITLITATDGYEQDARIYRVSMDFYIYATE
jgi:hypothetical protein